MEHEPFFKNTENIAAREKLESRKRWGFMALIYGGIITTSLLITACGETNDVYKMREEDTNGDTVINITDLALQRKNVDKKDVTPTGEFGADDLERGWIANHVGVRFKPGTIAESNLSLLNSKTQTEVDVERLKKEARQYLGYNEDWSVASFSDPEEGFTATLIIPDSVLENTTLGEVIKALKQKSNVLDAFRDYLVNLH